MPCFLFNVALEKVIRDAGTNTGGTIYYKSVQILAFWANIYIIAYTKKQLSENCADTSSKTNTSGNSTKSGLILINSKAKVLLKEM